jgi:hypothetical protein
MPFYRFTIDTNVPPHAVAERLRSVIGETRNFLPPFRPWPTEPFIGKLQEDCFKIRRNILYRNSFVPIIHGRLIPTPTGTRIVVTMRMYWFVMLFMMGWLAGAASASIHLPIFWAMFAFGIGLTCAGFFPEALKARRLLEETISSLTRQSTTDEIFFGIR